MSLPCDPATVGPREVLRRGEAPGTRCEAAGVGSAARLPGRERVGLFWSCVLGLLCLCLWSGAYGQQAPTQTQTESFWSESQKQTYETVKAILDRGEEPTSRQRRALEQVCDQLALSLRSDEHAAERGAISDLLVAVDSYAVNSVVKHLLEPAAPDIARLYGIIILVSIADVEGPKEAIIKALDDPSPAVRLWALRGVIQKQYTEAGEKVVPLLLDESPEVRLAAARAVQLLKVSGAENALVTLAAQEVARRAPLMKQMIDLQKQLESLQSGAQPAAEQQAEKQQQINLLRQRIDELSGQISVINLLIFRAGEALATLTNGADGAELKGTLSDEDLQKVIAALQAKYGSATP